MSKPKLGARCAQPSLRLLSVLLSIGVVGVLTAQGQAR